MYCLKEIEYVLSTCTDIYVYDTYKNIKTSSHCPKESTLDIDRFHNIEDILVCIPRSI